MNTLRALNAGRRAADAAVAPIEILIAEDSSTQAERLRYLLEQHHYQVVIAEDGAVALDWLANHWPALVITDINMPRLNGYDLCRKVKADKRLRDVPVILLTSLSDAMDVLEGLACGADSFITKPYSEEYLMARVERTLIDAALPHSQRASIRVEIPIPGQSGVITADPQRMVSLLISTYEAAIFRNTELVQTQDALSALNEHLEDLVEDRTAVLTAEMAAREQRERELEAIAAISVALRAANTRAQMLPVVLDQVMTLLAASAASVAMRDPATDELELILGGGEMANLTGLRLPAGAGIGGQALATGKPYTSDNLSADPHWYQVEWLREIRAAVCVPLVTSQNVLGVLWAIRPAPFIEAEVRLLSAIADIVASAMHRAGLHEQTEQRLGRLIALREIDNAIMNSLDLRTTLTIILGQVTNQLQVDAADILLLNRGIKVLEYAAGHGFLARGIEKARLRLGEGHAGQAALERRLVVVPDLRSQPPAAGRADLLAQETFVGVACVPLVAKGQVVGVMEVWTRAPLNPDSDWLSFLETLAGQSAIAVSDAWLYSDLQRSNQDMFLAYDSTLEGWSAALDLRDKETEGHSQRVTEMTLRLARHLGVHDVELEHIRRGALLHDIGKMGVPDAILFKPAPLTDEEWVVMRRHPGHAYDLLAPIAYLQRALDIPYCHHEKWNGAGYPRQLKGDAIPLAARIFAVVDVWDALRSDRPYRRGWSEGKVRAHICEQSGQHFDPQVVAAFLAMQASTDVVEPAA